MPSLISIFVITLVSLSLSDPINFLQPAEGQKSTFVYTHQFSSSEPSIPKNINEEINGINQNEITIEAFVLDSNFDRNILTSPQSLNQFNKSNLNLDSANSLRTENSLDFILELSYLDNNTPLIFKLVNYQVGTILYDTLIASYKGEGGISGYVNFMRPTGDYVGFYRLSYDKDAINDEGRYDQDYHFNMTEYYLSENQNPVDSIVFTREPEFTFLDRSNSKLKDSIYTETIITGNFTDYVNGTTYYLRASSPKSQTNSPPKNAIFVTAKNTSFANEAIVRLSLVSKGNGPAVWEGYMQTQDMMCSNDCLLLSQGLNHMTFEIAAQMQPSDKKQLVAVQYFERNPVSTHYRTRNNNPPDFKDNWYDVKGRQSNTSYTDNSAYPIYLRNLYTKEPAQRNRR